MHALMVATLALVLIAVPVAGAQPALSFAVEFLAGTLSAAVPFYSALYSTSEVQWQSSTSQFAEPATEDILLGLVAPPLAAGAAVALIGSLFTATSPHAGLAAILGASVGEVFALQLWQLDIPEWLKTIAVPAITSLGATMAFNRQVRFSL